MFRDFRANKTRKETTVVPLSSPARIADPTLAVADATDPRLQAHLELKSKLHELLLDRLNLSMIDKVEASELKRQIASLVSRELEQQSVPMRAEAFSELVEELIFEVLGLGPLEPLLADPTVNDILVNTHQSVYVERLGVLERTDVRFRDERHLLRIIDKIVSRVGRRIDESRPWVDARLEDGSRVNAIIRPCSVDGPALSIRKFSRNPMTLSKLVEIGSLDAKSAAILKGLVEARLNILISGGTGSGKTTLLNAMSAFVDGSHRIVTIEDAAELQLLQEHVVRLETRPANTEGRGAVHQRELVRNALRMRPDRIIVGEVRGAECFDMLQAMNTGHDGSMTTVHANSPRDALSRLEQMVTMIGADLPVRTIRSQIAAAIHVVVQVSRLSDGQRRITSISEITGMEGEVITMQEIFSYRRTGKTPDGMIKGAFSATGIRPRFFEHFAASGVEVDAGMFSEKAPSDA